MNSPIVKYGVIYGVVSIVFTLAVYLIAPQLFAKFWLGFISIAIAIFFMSQAIKDVRSTNGGYIDFGSAFVQGLGTFVVGLVISSIFTYILYNFIDPGLEDVIKGHLAETMSGFEEMMGEEAFDQMLEGVEAQDMASIGTTIKNVFGGSLFGAIIALIVAAIMKKNRPMMDALDDQV